MTLENHFLLVIFVECIIKLYEKNINLYIKTLNNIMDFDCVLFWFSER